VDIFAIVQLSCLICYCSRYTYIIERHLQQTLNKLQTWVDTNAFKFFESKTVCLHFCKLRTVNPDPVLLLNGTPIAVVEQVKFSGLIFVKQLPFIPHLRYLKQKCLKALNLLRVVSSTKWGIDEKTLLHLYHALIRSKLDYGSVVYSSARKSYLQMLEPIQNHALRLCLGTFRTSRVSSLHVEANEMPLELRRRKLAAQYCLKVSTDTSNPAVNCIFNKCFTAFFHRYPSQIRPLASVSALICVPFISHRRIYFHFLLLHILRGFTVNLFLISLLIRMQNLIPVLKFSKVTSWQFVTNYLTIITYTHTQPFYTAIYCSSGICPGPPG